jgi:hypothetical protein
VAFLFFAGLSGLTFTLTRLHFRPEGISDPNGYRLRF